MRKSKSPLHCSLLHAIMLIVPFMTFTTNANAQLRERHVTGANISAEISQYLEFLPAGYNDPANINKKYPLILYWKGLFDYDVNAIIQKGVPQKIESYVFPETVTYNGVQYKFIVVSPMYNDGGAGAWDVDAMINFMMANYRVDPNRIYMTGISKGASLCYEYINASFSFAKKIAAIAPLAPCTGLSWPGGTNAVNAHIHLWGIHNPVDLTCNVAATTSSVFNVNSQNPAPPVLASYTLTPTNWSSDPHDIFWIPYEPSYNTPESGGKNMYDWFIQFSQANALPVSLKDFNARLINGKVKLEWVTSVENNSGSFTVDRAGKDMRFVPIAKVDASGYSSAEKKYQLTDNTPLQDVSFYRLSQTDRDGKKQYFEVKRILNGKQMAAVVIAPNPVKSNVTVFMTIDKPQRVSISITDMHGRVLKNVQQLYQEGLQEINLPAANLAPGTYVLKVSGTTINAVEKITKQ